MKELNICTPRKANVGMDNVDMRNAVMHKLADDANSSSGPNTIQASLAQDGIHIPMYVFHFYILLRKYINILVYRNTIKDIMKEVNPDGFIQRDPKNKGKRKQHIGRVLTAGPHDKWAGDGHEKLKAIGFPIYGIRDYWGKIHTICVVPNDRNEHIVDYVYLFTVAKNHGRSH
jgi:hypothetical protein